MLRNFWNYFKRRCINFIFCVFCLETLTVSKSIFSSFEKKKILSIFFQTLSGWEFFSVLRFFILSQISKKKDISIIEDNYPPPLCNTSLVFQSVKNFPILSVSLRKLKKEIATFFFFCCAKIVRRRVVVFNYTDCLKENFPFPISVENWQKIFHFRSVKPDKI